MTMENLKNQSGYAVTTNHVYTGTGVMPKSDTSTLDMQETKPPIPVGSGGHLVHTAQLHQQALNVFNKNVSSLTHQLSGQRQIVISGTRHPAPNNPVVPHHPSYNVTGGGFNVTINGAHINAYSKAGSDYSSPRSSVGSAGDSKGSSPRSSLVQPPPPPPYDPRTRSSISSNISYTSLESNPSPRTSLAGGIMYDRYPSPRNSMAFQTDNPGVLNTYHVHTGLFDRFNESAPPPQMTHFTDPRLRTIAPQSQASINGHFLNPATTVNTTSLQTLQNGHYTPMVASTANIQIKPRISQMSPPPKLPARVPIKTSQTETEQNLTQLTERLQHELSLSISPSSSAPQSPTHPREPPPPYHGPHKTEPMPGPRNSSSKLSAPAQGLQTTMSTMGTHLSMHQIPPRTPPSATVRPQTQIPYQVTPPKQKGPTEAEKKLMALTKQLEEEMEATSQGEYFGKHFIISWSFSEFVDLRSSLVVTGSAL